MLTLRSDKIKFGRQVCFPGGFVSKSDSSVVDTCLREMSEEIGLRPESTEILGIMRCNWSDVASLTGIAVTPVVGFVGNIDGSKLKLNKDEVEEVLIIPVRKALDRSKWIVRDYAAPVFSGSKYVIWGLTAYLLDHFLQEVLMKASSSAMISFCGDWTFSGHETPPPPPPHAPPQQISHCCFWDTSRRPTT